MSPITIVLIAGGALLATLAVLAWIYVISPAIIENRNLSEVDWDEPIPDQTEEEDEDEEYDDDEDEEYDDDEENPEDLIFGPDSEKPSDFPDTITRLSRFDWIAMCELREQIRREEHPEYYVSAREYRDFWRAEASEYKIKIDLERAKFRKEMKLAA